MLDARKYFNRLFLIFKGYTLIELVTASTILLILGAMALGMTNGYKRYSIEERALARLMDLADAEERYRFSSDPTVNPESTYATFNELQIANYIAEDFYEDDVRAHTVNAFVPYYRMDIVRSQFESDEEPDANSYYVVIYPIPNKWNLKTFHMLEDGEVWHSYGLKYHEK